jgi:hypothetical protein
MKATSEAAVFRVLRTSWIKPREVDGTVILDPLCSFVLITIKQKGRASLDQVDFRFYAHDRFYLIGRERVCPFPRRISGKDSGIPASRCLILESRAELRYVLEDLSPFRYGVENDFYVFPEVPDFFIYASHHDELLFYALALGSQRDRGKSRRPTSSFVPAE